MSQHVRFGEGLTASVAEALDDLRPRRLLLVTGSTLFETSGAAVAMAETLADRDVRRFSEFEPNPKFADLLCGLEVVRDYRPEAVLGVGGGSVLDMAKLLATCATQDADPEAIAIGAAPVDRQGLPLIAVPTTAGTGSEATHFAVVYVNGRKYSVAAPGMLPSWAIVDPCLTYAVPAQATAETGLDAISQAMESLWSVNSTAESRDYARRSLSLSLPTIETAVKCPDPASRRAMAEAAHLAGMAINISFTTAPHALSYSLTSRFGVAHGLAAALTLASVLEYNAGVTDADANDPRGAVFVRDRLREIVDLVGGDDPAQAATRVRELIETLGLPNRLREVGVTPSDLDDLAGSVNVQRLANNPRALSAPAVRAVLDASY